MQTKTSCAGMHSRQAEPVLAPSTNMRGGRGGGRGRGRSAPSAGQELIRETQMDLGIDKFGTDQVSSALPPFHTFLLTLVTARTNLECHESTGTCDISWYQVPCIKRIRYICCS